MSEKKKKDLQQYKFCKIVAVITFIISVALISVGFAVPPCGIIDGSVLTAVGELFSFPLLFYSARAIELGMEIKYSKGDTTLEISKDN